MLGRVNRCITGEIAQRWAGPGTALLEGRAAQGKWPKSCELWLGKPSLWPC